MRPSPLCSVAARRHIALAGLLALGLATGLAAAAEFETDDRIFPTPAARWEFAEEPVALRQVTASQSGHAFLTGPGGIRFRDGKTAEVMTPAQESARQDGATRPA